MLKKYPRLQNLLKYENDNVVKRYVKDYGGSKDRAEKIFKNLLIYLWLNGKSRVTQSGIRVSMYNEMLAMDHMWHSFILFTQDYMDFSHKYFGDYFHHTPTTTKHTHQEKVQIFTNFISYAYDNLGPLILCEWFKLKPEKSELPRDEFLKLLHKKQF